MVHHINQRKDNNMISFVDAEKNIWQNSTSIYDKNSNQNV